MTTALELGASTTVYSLVYPEIQNIIDRIAKDFPHDIYKEAWTKKQDVMHDEFLDRWKLWSRPFLPNIKWELEFPQAYPCNGSSEAIRESLAMHAAHNDKPTIHVFRGEYEGYRAVAEGYGIDVCEYDRAAWRSWIRYDRVLKPGDCFYISHPSSLDGNIWPDMDEFLLEMMKYHPEVKIRLDLCYLGTTSGGWTLKNIAFNVDMIFFSLSKVFGVYYHRIGGVFSKLPMPGLFGNRWFKNLFSLRLGTTLMKEFGPFDLPAKYHPLQVEAVAHLNEHTLDANITPSDVVLLAHRPTTRQGDCSAVIEDWERPLVRQNYLRYCLTPYMGRKLGQ